MWRDDLNRFFAIPSRIVDSDPCYLLAYRDVMVRVPTHRAAINEGECNEVGILHQGSTSNIDSGEKPPDELFRMSTGVCVSRKLPSANPIIVHGPDLLLL